MLLKLYVASAIDIKKEFNVPKIQLNKRSVFYLIGLLKVTFHFLV